MYNTLGAPTRGPRRCGAFYAGLHGGQSRPRDADGDRQVRRLGGRAGVPTAAVPSVLRVPSTLPDVTTSPYGDLGIYNSSNCRTVEQQLPSSPERRLVGSMYPIPTAFSHCVALTVTVCSR
jgi:hypothetical protein